MEAGGGPVMWEGDGVEIVGEAERAVSEVFA